MKNNFIIKKILKNITDVVGNGKISLHEPVFWGNEKKYLSNCIDSTFVSSAGKFVDSFEEKIKKYTKSNYVLATNSGTSAMHISFIVSDIRKNDEVLIPALNFVASSNATIYCGAIPHFIDVEKKTLGVDAEKLYNYLKKISKKKGNHCYNIKTKRRIKALIPTHTFGHSVNLDKIIKITKLFNLDLIEDAAESFGSFYKKRHLGTFGRMGILSFNGNKTITTGSGGAILIKNKSDFIKAKKLINVSKISHKWKLIYDGIGYNYKMSSLQAALGCAQLENLEKIISKKYKLLKKYKNSFKENFYGKIFEQNDFRRSNYWLQTLILNENCSKIRDAILERGNLKKIQLRPVWRLMHKLKHLKKFPRMNLAVAEKLERRIINLPSSIYN